MDKFWIDSIGLAARTSPMMMHYRHGILKKINVKLTQYVIPSLALSNPAVRLSKVLHPNHCCLNA